MSRTKEEIDDDWEEEKEERRKEEHDEIVQALGKIATALQKCSCPRRK